MRKFIELTQRVGEKKGLVRVNAITQVIADSEGAIVCLVHGSFPAKESYEEVRKKLVGTMTSEDAEAMANLMATIIK